VACAEMFEEGHHVIMVEIMSDVKEQDLKGQCPPGGLTPPEEGLWRHDSQFHLSNRGFPCPLHGYLRNTQ